MSDDRRDGLDARIDRVLRQQTTPAPDPAFRARVLARLDEAPAASPRMFRLAVPVAALLVVVGLFTFVRIAPKPFASRSATRTVTTEPTRPDAATAATSESAAPGAPTGEPVGSGREADARLKGLAGGESAPLQGAQARRAAERPVTTRPFSPATTVSPATESDLTPTLARVDVGEVSVTPIEVRPLSTTERFAALGEPEPVAVEPIGVGPIGGR